MPHLVSRWHDEHMKNEEDLQEVLRQNLRVLLAMQRMSHAQLAERLGTDRATVTKNMNGHRKWSLQDLATLGEIFGVTAPALIDDTAKLVGAVNPARTGTDAVTGRVTEQYRSGIDARVLQFPLARTGRPGYRRNWRQREARRKAFVARSDAGHLIAAPVA